MSRQFLDQAGALSTRRRMSDVGPAESEELLLSKLHLIPGWIADYYVKATAPASVLVVRLLVQFGSPKHSWESEMRMKESVLFGQATDFDAEGGIASHGVFQQ